MCLCLGVVWPWCSLPVPPAPVVEEPTMEAMKADEALRLSTLLVDKAAEPSLVPCTSPTETDMRQRCADYWMGTWAGKVKPFMNKAMAREADRLVPANEPLLSDKVVVDEMAHYTDFNVRRMRELPRQLCLGGRLDRLRDELCSPATLDFFSTPVYRDHGELRVLFEALGGLNEAAAAYTVVVRAKLDSLKGKELSSDEKYDLCPMSFIILLQILAPCTQFIQLNFHPCV